MKIKFYEYSNGTRRNLAINRNIEGVKEGFFDSIDFLTTYMIDNDQGKLKYEDL